MIKKNEETGKVQKTSFKKFSDFTKTGDDSNASSTILPEDDMNRPGFPNLPNTKTVRQKNSSTRYMKPLADKQDWDKEELSSSIDEKELELDQNSQTENKVEESKNVKLYGKVAKLPKGTKASKGFNFLENVKISKNSIWYLMVEKDNELQMVKYNYKKGVDLNKFVNELKAYYIDKNKGNKSICESLSKVSVDGNDKYSMIRNIPLVEVDGKKLITKITEDLIKLLSK